MELRMSKMNVHWRLSTTIIALIALIIVAVVMAAWAQNATEAPVVKSEFQKIEATLEAIDPATRAVSLRGPNGSVSLILGPEVRNFDKLHVGDKVIVSYYQGVAAQMAKGDTRVTDPAASSFEYRAKHGLRPGGGAGASVTTTVTIEAVDLETNTVAFRLADGSVDIIGVKSPNIVRFIRTLKPGDSVDVTYTESIAVNVVPAAAG
jgi:hypothetical protein